MYLKTMFSRLVLFLFILTWSPVQASEMQPSLAIFNLRPLDFEAMNFSSEILFTLVSSLELENIDIMPRRQMEEILYQEGLVQNDNPEQVAKAANVLAVNYILFGNVRTGDGIKAEVKLMDVSRKKVENTWYIIIANSDDIGSRIPVFAGELVDYLHNGPLESPPSTSQSEPEPPGVEIDTLTAQSKGKEVLLSWTIDPQYSVSGFRVYRSNKAEGPFQFLGKSLTDKYIDSKVKIGFSYYYCLGILQSSGKEVRSERIAFVEKAGEKMPFPPLIISGKGHIGRAVISFVPSLQNEQENFDIEHYKVYRKKRGDDEFSFLTSLKEKKNSFDLKLTFEDEEDLEDGQTYVYVLKSVDRKERESVFSDPVSITLIDRPQLRLTQDMLLRKVRLSWEKIDNIKGYHLYRRPDGGEWKKIETVYDQEQTDYIDDSSLEDGVRYDYYLTAYDDQEASSASNIISASTKELPPHPTGVKAQSGLVKSVRLTWEMVKDPDVGGYAVYRGLKKDELERIKKVRGYETASYLDEGAAFSPLADGETYYYGIRSYNLFDAESEKLSPIVKATTKPRPQKVNGLQARPEHNAIVVQWQANPEADISSYEISRRKNQGWWSSLETIDAGRTNYRDSDLKPEANYQYRVIALDKDDLKSDPGLTEIVMSPLVKTDK